jgi:hypothetical protein
MTDTLHYNRVSKAMPCPVCTKPDWCLVSDDARYAICQRVESEHKKGGAGWRHTLDGQTFSPPKNVIKTVTKPHNAEAIQKIYCNLDFRDSALRPLADKLNVTMDSLRNLGVGKSCSTTWDFPMFNDRLEIIGLKRRNLDGKKWCATGSKLGIYVPKFFNRFCRCIILEGESDTAAMLSKGYNAIGRPNTTAGLQYIIELTRSQEIVILADNDEPKKRPDGTIFFPGQESAYALRKRLESRACVVICPMKDARLWINSGKFNEWIFDHLIIKARKEVK